MNVPEGEIPVTGAEQPPAQPAQQQPIMPAPQFEEEAPEPPTDHHPRILSSSRGPDKTVDDPALASLASKHGKLTLVRFQDEQGRGISTEVQDSMGRALSTIKDPEMMEEEVIEDEAMHELEQKYGKLTVSRFVNVGSPAFTGQALLQFC